MGAHYWSLAVSGEVRQQVDDTVTRWLERKGFEQVPAGELRFEIDDEIERGFFLLSNARWTIVLYSHYQEMERLELELNGLGQPVLGLWLHDSDIWGYELSRDGAIVSAFHSNPRYFGAEEPARGPNDVEALAETTGVDTAAIRELQSRRAVFKERVCEAFARRLGIAPAASQYGYRCVGETAPGEEGFLTIHRRFRLRERARLEGFALHSIRAHAASTSAASASPARRSGPDWGTLAQDVAPGQLLAMRSLFVLSRIVSFVVRPLAFLLGGVLRLVLRARTGAGDSVGESLGAGHRQRLVDGFLVDPSERFRVRLVEGAAPIERPLAPGGIAFRVGALDVYGGRLHERVARASLERGRGTILYEDDFRIGALPAKAVGWREDGGAQAGAESHCIYVQTPWLVYRFAAHSRQPPTAADAAAMRRAVDSFEVVEAAGS